MVGLKLRFVRNINIHIHKYDEILILMTKISMATIQNPWKTQHIKINSHQWRFMSSITGI